MKNVKIVKHYMPGARMFKNLRSTWLKAKEDKKYQKIQYVNMKKAGSLNRRSPQNGKTIEASG